MNKDGLNSELTPFDKIIKEKIDSGKPEIKPELRSSIFAELDKVMPVESSTPTPTPASSSNTKWIITSGLVIIAGALIYIFWPSEIGSNSDSQKSPIEKEVSSPAPQVNSEAVKENQPKEKVNNQAEKENEPVISAPVIESANIMSSEESQLVNDDPKPIDLDLNDVDLDEVTPIADYTDSQESEEIVEPLEVSEEAPIENDEEPQSLFDRLKSKADTGQPIFIEGE